MINFVCILIKVPHEDRLRAACIAITFSSKLLQSEYCINAIDGINNLKMLRMLILLFCCSVIPYSVFSGVPVN